MLECFYQKCWLPKTANSIWTLEKTPLKFTGDVQPKFREDMLYRYIYRNNTSLKVSFMICLSHE